MTLQISRFLLAFYKNIYWHKYLKFTSEKLFKILRIIFKNILLQELYKIIFVQKIGKH